MVSLPKEEGSDEQYLLANVNRWRRAVGFAAHRYGRAAETNHRVLKLKEGEASLVDLEGESASGGGMSAPSPVAAVRAVRAVPRLQAIGPPRDVAASADVWLARSRSGAASRHSIRNSGRLGSRISRRHAQSGVWRWPRRASRAA